MLSASLRGQLFHGSSLRKIAFRTAHLPCVGALLDELARAEGDLGEHASQAVTLGNDLEVSRLNWLA